MDLEALDRYLDRFCRDSSVDLGACNKKKLAHSLNDLQKKKITRYMTMLQLKRDMGLKKINFHTPLIVYSMDCYICGLIPYESLFRVFSFLPFFIFKM